MCAPLCVANYVMQCLDISLKAHVVFLQAGININGMSYCHQKLEAQFSGSLAFFDFVVIVLRSNNIIVTLSTINERQS